MKNNKGFSLVELIIVIAIMAILVGVMAPQLIRYIEKTNVSSDTQLADTVAEAIVTAMMDPAVITASGYTEPAASGSIGSDLNGCESAVYETLGVTAAADVVGQLKSKDASGITYTINNGNSVTVTITGSHADAKGGADPITVTR